MKQVSYLILGSILIGGHLVLLIIGSPTPFISVIGLLAGALVVLIALKSLGYIQFVSSSTTNISKDRES